VTQVITRKRINQEDMGDLKDALDTILEVGEEMRDAIENWLSGQETEL
jgi:hypothetical protein